MHPDVRAFRVDLADPVHPVVEVGGVDVSRHLRRATLDLQSRELPRLFLEIAAHDNIDDIDGVAVVEPVREPGEGADVAYWLRSLDPAVLDRAVLEHPDLDRDGAAATFLAVLAGWADRA